MFPLEPLALCLISRRGSLPQFTSRYGHVRGNISGSFSLTASSRVHEFMIKYVCNYCIYRTASLTTNLNN